MMGDHFLKDWDRFVRLVLPKEEMAEEIPKGCWNISSLSYVDWVRLFVEQSLRKEMGSEQVETQQVHVVSRKIRSQRWCHFVLARLGYHKYHRD
jgi:hypothetical protein